MLDLEPLSAHSLVDHFVDRFARLILSGQLEPGTRLPPERALAAQLEVSRPVVHEGLVELAARGLVEVRPRHCTVVLDWQRDGSMALLATLFSQADTALDPRLLLGMLDTRLLVEVEAARLAAAHGTAQHLAEVRAAHERLARASTALERMTADFALHHAVARASANPILPMLLKSCEPAFLRLGTAFYAALGSAGDVLALQSELLSALESHQPEAAAAAMQRLLDHGREVLLQSLEPS